MYYLLTVIGLAIGLALGYVIRKTIAQSKANSIEAKTQLQLEEAKNKEREILLKAKDKSLQIIEEAKKDEVSRRRELNNVQSRLEKREELFDKKLLELESKQTKIQDRAKEVEQIKEQIKKIKQDQLNKLERIAGLDKEKALQVLLDNVEKENEESLMIRMKKLQNESATELEREAKKTLANVIQRCSVNHSSEMTTTTIDLPSDEMKGRIIGREGRNIRAIEQLTGVEIVVDDTPNVITISGFSPIRRHVAKRALEKLILDGRIHPAKIESAIEEAKKELALEIQKAGEEAAYEVGIAGLDPKLIQILGRLKYRTSYGQNVLQHTIEVTHLAALLAEQLGADVNVCRKAGLLHDIGKAVDHEIQGTHIEIGVDICKKFGIPEDVIKAGMQHHDDKPETLEGVIIKTADAISGARPGARKDTYERYLQRLNELESIAKGFEGVEKTYAIQAGREVRVFVNPTEISDLQAEKLAQAIAKKIEAELKYPGEIKVAVIRENRIIEYAR
ncbi:ribonuclease Y [Candidatus Falkowbacteria bacterium RIFOXYD2_FULL_35_9]|uniref:Ribonuclease Y n=1 Tax=Candidatus Falkowbacteria bacterium RIFOXYC2_FULL_36_12 TaxID=1798002 RepID=A0A1F5T333_9BACT|nr:MAG: ribonuclease Y [Candidatus Falkowbacteria bacterium RIFOXYB2_FULL_35_7]OGF33080.1 MAG: ribonuclease Y [Candidatus Falkowbacteria bacterium RIFOXYA2_FULL_35_8]OGF33358.1 MAG: ribonuclease Y [Candidatus Falkowbacteria bacterium RIFOXYC2_FULL_36_12]OGF45603.1 MAG: ribonuclease Y [Candidatus Falkowbacteria bacterium RIFOXYD2_FULL_35_9]